MTAVDYDSCVGQGETATVGPLPATAWDPSLAARVAEAGRPLYEEQLRNELLAAIVASG